MRQNFKVIGVTGSIGMGKSTISALLERLGIAIFDSDAFVADLYAPGAAGAMLFAKHPVLKRAVKKDTKNRPYVDRKALRGLFFKTPTLREDLNALIHPLVRLGQDQFIARCHKANFSGVALDIPLLYETGADARCDFVIVASAPTHIQKKRVARRKHYTDAQFRAIISKQMPDAQKCTLADHIINTSDSRANIYKGLRSILIEEGVAIKHTRKA